MSVLDNSCTDHKTRGISLKTRDKMWIKRHSMSDESDATCDEAQSTSIEKSGDKDSLCRKGSSDSSSTSIDNFLGVRANMDPETNNFLGVGGETEPGLSFLNTVENADSGTNGFFGGMNDHPHSDHFLPFVDNSCSDSDPKAGNSRGVESEQKAYSENSHATGFDSLAQTEGNAYTNAQNTSDCENQKDRHLDTNNFLGIGKPKQAPDNFLQTKRTKTKQKAVKKLKKSELLNAVKIEVDVAESECKSRPSNLGPDLNLRSKARGSKRKDSSKLLRRHQTQPDSSSNTSRAHSVCKDASEQGGNGLQDVATPQNEKTVGCNKDKTGFPEQTVGHTEGSLGVVELSPWQIKVEPQSDDSMDGSSAMMGSSSHAAIHSNSYAVSAALISCFSGDKLLPEDMDQGSSMNSGAADSRSTARTVPTLHHMDAQLHIKQEIEDPLPQPLDHAKNTRFINAGRHTVSYDPTNFSVEASAELANFVVKMEPESDQDTVIEGGIESRRDDFSSAEEERPGAGTKKQTRARKPRNRTSNDADKPRPHHCQYCDLSFIKLSRLKEHTRVHTDERPFTCQECNISFRKSESLKVHIRKHTGELPFRCDKCDSAFKCSQELKRHLVRKHTTVRPFSCADCDLRFWSQSDLRGHRRIHTGEKPYKCTECHSAFRKSSALTCHMRIHTGQKPYSCPECDRTFRRSDQMKRHVKLHSGEKPYECSQCDAAFTYSTDLKKHCARKHSLVKAFACPECGNKFFTNEDLKMHRVFHLNIKPHSCAECGAGFVRPSDLKVHMRIHTGERPFACDQCSAAFTRSGDLKLHVRMHDGKRPFTCSVCNLSFRRSGHLKRHMNTHNGQKTFCCEDCDAAFFTSSDLKRHASRVHKRDICKFGCSDCGVRFFTSRSLAQHLMRHTIERPFPCSLCDAAFTHADLLDTHMEEIHGIEEQMCKVEPGSEEASAQFMYIDVSMIAEETGSILDVHDAEVPATQIFPESL